LWGLKYVENALRQDCRATLALTVLKNGPSEEEIREEIARAGCVIIAWGVSYEGQGRRCDIRAEIQRRALPGDTRTPTFVSQWAHQPLIELVQWKPQGISSSSESRDSGPQGLPIAISGPE
jgi:hypothetical protein